MLTIYMLFLFYSLFLPVFILFNSRFFSGFFLFNSPKSCSFLSKCNTRNVNVIYVSLFLIPLYSPRAAIKAMVENTGLSLSVHQDEGCPDHHHPRLNRDCLHSGERLLRLSRPRRRGPPRILWIWQSRWNRHPRRIHIILPRLWQECKRISVCAI